MSTDLLGIVRDALVIAYLFVLRLGVPLLITLMIGAWLKQWLEEHAAKVEPQAQPTLRLNGRHCWEVRHTPETEQAKAAAEQRPDLPCWLALQVDDGGLKQMCYTCPLFTAHASTAAKA